MKICFLWHFIHAPRVFNNWRDGLRAAVEKIGQQRKYQVMWFIGEDVEPPKNADFYLLWDDANSPMIRQMSKWLGRKGLCLTSDTALPPENLRLLDVVYCESSVVFDKVRALGVTRAIKAFGTDDEYFTPDENVVKDIPYFYPATFSPWKRQSVIAHLGKDLTCIGMVQPDGAGELEACKKAGVKIIDDYIPVDDIRHYYRRAQQVVIPAEHGSERTVLESMSMNILPTVNAGNHRAYSYIQEYENNKGLTPREFVLQNYSAEKYADELLKGILNK